MTERPSARLEAAWAAIDAANAQDPRRVEVGGQEMPLELAHAQAMTRWVQHLDPAADEVALVAARAHHLRRWETPRATFPEGRAGYLRWRADAARRHAEGVRALLEGLGFSDDEVDRVAAIVRKEGLGTDPVVGVHEDARCLVFFEMQLADVVAALGAEHAARVLDRTVSKMRDHGRETALMLARGGTLPEPAATALAAALERHPVVEPPRRGTTGG